jgi:hypothetical protein
MAAVEKAIMISAHDFALATCQATIFTPDEEISAVKVIKGLLPRWLDKFDAEPIILPTPSPREVPKLILQSSTGTWRCEVGSDRVNILWNRVKNDLPVLSMNEFYMEATRLFLDYRESIQPRVGRFAAVVTRYALQPSPGLFLSRHFCQEKWHSAPLNRPQSFELHVHKRFLIADQFQVNSWVRSKTGTLQQENAPQEIVLVEQDLNTPSEDLPSRSYDMDEMRKFFQVVIPEFDAILKLYFPIEESQ